MGGTRLIGLSGRKSSGKNTVGDYLSVLGSETIAYAAKLKQSAAALFGFDPDVWDDVKNDPEVTITYRDPKRGVEIVLTARQFLQRYGTEAHRDVFGDDFWVRALFDPLDMDGENIGKRYAITDVRFPDEHQAVRDRGGIVLRIERETDDHGDTHASEDLPGYDFVDWIIQNNGTFEDLYAEVDAVIAADRREA